MQAEVKVIRSGQCNSLSGKSVLTYQFGRREGEEGVLIRIAHNSGGGMFCDDWVSMADVLSVLNDPGNRESISSMAFRSLYLGKSINTPSFLMAALQGEEVIAPHLSKKRAYQVFDLGAFEERMAALSQLPLPEPTEEVVIEAPADASGEAPADEKPEETPRRKRR